MPYPQLKHLIGLVAGALLLVHGDALSQKQIVHADFEIKSAEVYSEPFDDPDCVMYCPNLLLGYKFIGKVTLEEPPFDDMGGTRVERDNVEFYYLRTQGAHSDYALNSSWPPEEFEGKLFWISVIEGTNQIVEMRIPLHLQDWSAGGEPFRREKR